VKKSKNQDENNKNSQSATVEAKNAALTGTEEE